jgi:hypothetical protein
MQEGMLKAANEILREKVRIVSSLWAINFRFYSIISW